MDLNLLETFVVVAQAPSFSAAAGKLGLRRSSVSRSVAALEAALDVQLFNRTTRQVALTAAGRALYARVAPQLATLRDSLGTLPEREEQPSGELRLTAPNDLGAMLLPDVIASFLVRYPRVSIDVRLTNRVVDLVAEGFDAAFRVATARLADSSLVARKLFDTDLQIFAAPDYLARAGTPRTAPEAAALDWVSFRRARVPRPLPAPTRKPRLVVDDVTMLHAAVKAGIGLGVLPTFLARQDVAAGRLVRVLPRVVTRSGLVHFVHPPAQHPPRKLSAFRDHLLDHLASHPFAAR